MTLVTSVTFHEPRKIFCLFCGNDIKQENASTLGDIPVQLASVFHVRCERCETNHLATLFRTPHPHFVVSLTDLMKDDFQHVTDECVTADDVLAIHEFLHPDGSLRTA